LERYVIKAVIYDMDGLLIDSEPLWRKAEMQVFAEVGINLSEEDCKETMGYRLNEVVELWYSRSPWEGPTLEEIEEKILDTVKNLIMDEGEAMPGVYESIQCFKNKGMSLAVASSSPMLLINAVLEKLKIRPEFKVIHSAQYEEYGKPHPGVFISTAKKLQVMPEECLVLEDSFHGVVAGLAAKMKVFAVPDAASLEDIRFKTSHRLLSSLEKLDCNSL
jgi:sugar-phosphatase